LDENQPSVLVVEDQEAVRSMLGRMLEKSGFQVELVASGDEALVRLRSDHTFGAIVADLLMPGVHGIAFLKLVQELAPSVPLIVHTGSEIGSSALALAGCEVAAYLRKPLETSRLPAAVASAFAQNATLRS
jgi:DNA-binding NtrC family response regulator